MCIPADVSLRKADIVLQELSTLINTLPSLPKTEHDASNPLQCFLHSEVQLMQHIVQVCIINLNLQSAEIFLYKPWRPNVFF